MRRIAQAPSHYEVELRQDDHRGEQDGPTWRAIKGTGPDGFMSALTFAGLEAARAYTKRMNPLRARIVAIERDGWRRVVDEAET